MISSKLIRQEHYCLNLKVLLLNIPLFVVFSTRKGVHCLFLSYEAELDQKKNRVMKLPKVLQLLQNLKMSSSAGNDEIDSRLLAKKLRLFSV